jgi:hypothetical protein
MDVQIEQNAHVRKEIVFILAFVAFVGLGQSSDRFAQDAIVAADQQTPLIAAGQGGVFACPPTEMPRRLPVSRERACAVWVVDDELEYVG